MQQLAKDKLEVALLEGANTWWRKLLLLWLVHSQVRNAYYDNTRPTKRPSLVRRMRNWIAVRKRRLALTRYRRLSAAKRRAIEDAHLDLVVSTLRGPACASKNCRVRGLGGDSDINQMTHFQEYEGTRSRFETYLIEGSEYAEKPSAVNADHVGDVEEKKVNE